MKTSSHRKKKHRISSRSRSSSKSKNIINLKQPVVDSITSSFNLNWLNEETTEYLSSVKQRDWKESLHEKFIVVCILFICLTHSFHRALKSLSYVWNHDQVHLMCFFSLLGVYVADLLTGLGHMVLDHTFIDAVPHRQRTWLQWLAYGFQLHHVNPLNWRHDDLLYHGILRTGFVIFLILFSLHNVSEFMEWVPEYTRMGWFLLEFVGLTTQVYHAAAHGRWRSNSLIRKLQTWGWILRPTDHALHHTRFDSNFAIATGWSNPLLNLFYETCFKKFVHPEMRAETQRIVYIDKKNELVFPYPQIFPDLRKTVLS